MIESVDATAGSDESLEAQRAFLLRSLDDLEAERADGNIDDETYARLHGDYTARAAAVLRAIEGDTSAPAGSPPPVPAKRRALVIGGVVVFAIAAAVTLALTIGPRQPGGTVTGGVTQNSQTASVLAAAVADHPNDYSARIEYARYLLGVDRVKALDQYTAAERLKPDEPEPPTYIGWIFGLASNPQNTALKASDRAELQAQAFSQFARARTIDPRYPDAYVFEGVVRDRYAGDPAGAIPLLQKYLELSPSGPLTDLVRSTLSDAKAQAAAPTTTSTAG